MCAAQLSSAKKAAAFFALESARPPEAGGLSFCGEAAKTCAARRRQARFLIGEQARQVS